MKHYIIIVLAVLVGRYVDMPLWQILIIGVMGTWELKQLRGELDDAEEPEGSPQEGGNDTTTDGGKTGYKFEILSKYRSRGQNGRF